MIQRLFILVALAASGCERQPQEGTAERATVPPDEVLATRARASKPPAVVPAPKDPAELDRMILAGYTPHGKHLHAPGVKECPLSQGSEAVM